MSIPTMRMVSLDPLVPSALIHALADIQQFVCRKAAMVGGPGYLRLRGFRDQLVEPHLNQLAATLVKGLGRVSYDQS